MNGSSTNNITLMSIISGKKYLFLFLLFSWISLSLSGQIKSVTKNYPDGAKLYEGFLENGKPTGLWKRYYETGKLMAELNYGTGSDTCAAKLYSEEDGVLMAQGVYVNKKKEGNWVFLIEDSESKTYSFFINDVQQGESKILDNEGKLIEKQEWKDGKLNGTSTRYDSNGDKQYEMNYKDDILNGKVIYYHPQNKVRMKGEYKDGLKVGIWKTFSKSGIESGSTEYLNGIPTNNDELIEKENERIRLIQSQKGKFSEPEPVF